MTVSAFLKITCKILKNHVPSNVLMTINNLLMSCSFPALHSHPGLLLPFFLFVSSNHVFFLLCPITAWPLFWFPCSSLAPPTFPIWFVPFLPFLVNLCVYGHIWHYGLNWSCSVKICYWESFITFKWLFWSTARSWKQIYIIVILTIRAQRCTFHDACENNTRAALEPKYRKIKIKMFLLIFRI